MGLHREEEEEAEVDGDIARWYICEEDGFRCNVSMGLEAVFAEAEFIGTSVSQYTWERLEAKIFQALGFTAEAF